MDYKRFKYDDVFNIISTEKNNLKEFEYNYRQSSLVVFKRATCKGQSKFRKNKFKRGISLSGVFEDSQRYFKTKNIALLKKSHKTKHAEIILPNINTNNISPNIPIKIGETSMAPGVWITLSENFSGIIMNDFIGHDIEGYIENGVLIIKGFYE